MCVGNEFVERGACSVIIFFYFYSPNKILLLSEQECLQREDCTRFRLSDFANKTTSILLNIRDYPN